MSTTHPIPDKEDLKQILAMLYGDALKLDKGNAVPADDTSKCMVAVYVNDNNEPVTACVCDHEFIAFAGAALSMIPAGGAQDAAKSGDFSEMMLGNHHEIMNICSRVFMKSSNAPHLKLDRIYSKPAELPDGVKPIVHQSTGRADFTVSIPGYGNGAMSFLCT